MSDSSAAKSNIMGDTHTRRKEKFYFRKRKNKYFLEPGFKGFFCTCSFREKDCIREVYNLLNEYADKLYPDLNADQVPGKQGSDNEETVDISDALKQEVESLKSESQKSLKYKRFQVVETGASNCIFIKTNLPCPEELTTAIVKDLYVTRQQKTRHVMRLLPILGSSKANLPDIMECAGKLLDKYFIKSPSTFAIIFNKRLNSSVSRELLIRELADLVVMKNSENKADLKNPQLSIVIEIIKGVCLLSIVEDYYVFKKYNIHELGKEEPKNDSEPPEPKKARTESTENSPTENSTEKEINTLKE